MPDEVGQSSLTRALAEKVNLISHKFERLCAFWIFLILEVKRFNFQQFVDDGAL